MTTKIPAVFWWSEVHFTWVTIALCLPQIKCHFTISILNCNWSQSRLLEDVFQQSKRWLSIHDFLPLQSSLPDVTVSPVSLLFTIDLSCVRHERNNVFPTCNFYYINILVYTEEFIQQSSDKTAMRAAIFFHLFFVFLAGVRTTQAHSLFNPICEIS